MLATSSTMTRTLTMPIHVVWKPVYFLAPVRPGVAICVKLIACVDPPTVGPSTPCVTGRGFLTTSLMSFQWLTFLGRCSGSLILLARHISPTFEMAMLGRVNVTLG